jgi:hypothetical protein
VLGSRFGRAWEPLGETDAAKVEAHVELDAARAAEDELGGTTAHVDDERSLVDLPAGGHAPKREERLLLSREEPRREAVAPLDLAEERLAVLGVPHSTRRERQGSLGAEPLDDAAVVGEDVPDAGNRRRKEEPARVHAFAEACDLDAPLAFSDGPVLDVGDEQAGRVRPEVDDSDAGHLRR